MRIDGLRIVDNDKLETPEGDVVAPVRYYMDVQLNEEESASVSINQDTYTTLHTILYGATSPETTTPMGVPA